MNNELQHRKVMTRKAADNKYLHKDFHISMNILLKFIYENYGKENLIKYLSQYAEAFYRPVNQKLKSGNLDVLRKYFTDIYETEEWSIKITCNEDYIKIEQEACPGISQILAKGEKPCPYYSETYNTVYQTLCMNTPFEYKLEYFDEVTGACKQTFKRRI